jgi:DnaJ-class molecular chaperone
VVKPAIPCPRCNGTGKDDQAGLGHGLHACVVCQGAGWALRISGAAS